MFSSPVGMRRFVSQIDGVPELQDEEMIHHTLRAAKLQLDEELPDTGDVFVTTRRFIFVGSISSLLSRLFNVFDSGKSTALDIDVPFIVLHALSRDTESYPEPCLYCQLDSEEDEDPHELRIVPADESDLYPLFEALSHAASLNPDPPEDGEEEGDDELVFDAEEVELGAEQARRLQRWDELLQESGELPKLKEARYQDAEESEEE